MNDGDLNEEHSSYSMFSPKCCKEHKNACSKRNHLETSEWKFEDENLALEERYFDPMNKAMPSTQRKLKCMEEVNKTLEAEKMQALAKEIEEFSSKKNKDKNKDFIQQAEFKSDISHGEPSSSKNTEHNENLKNLKKSKKETNPYLILLNRLDEEEGVRMPSIEDKLKLAEDSLRISTTKFCKACEELIDEKSDSPDSAEKFKFLRPEKAQEAFRAKVFDSKLRPPQTLSVSEIEKKSIIGTTETKEQKKESKRKLMKMKTLHKQGFYLPVNTWFTQEKETQSLSSEELDFLNSTSTKAFLKFIEERKKTPPKVLQEIQKKLQKMQEPRNPT